MSHIRVSRNLFSWRVWVSLALLLIAGTAAEGDDLPPIPTDFPHPNIAPTGLAEPASNTFGTISHCHDAPAVAAWTASAGPNEGVFVTGTGLNLDSFLLVQSLAGGPRSRASARWADTSHLVTTLPADAPSGPLLGWIGREGCWSPAFRLNAPQLWWAWPNDPKPGAKLRLFGRDLAPRVYLEPTEGRQGRWLDVAKAERYSMVVMIPQDIKPGAYRVWVHAGKGGRLGWSEASTIQVTASQPPARSISAGSVETLKQALAALAEKGGVVQLSAGTYRLNATLRVPKGVTLVGAGPDKTVLEFGAGMAPTAGLVNFDGRSDLLPGQKGPAAIAGVLILGSSSGLQQLGIRGGGVVEQGITVAGTRTAPLHNVVIMNVRVERLRPFDNSNSQGEALLARHVRGLEVRDSDLRGNGPALFLEDVMDSAFIGNTVAGQGEGVITGRTGGVRRCIIENNHVLSKKDGAPQAVRAVWLSTLLGSTYDNYLAGNHGADFHPPPGTEQNRGEAILLETYLTHPYFGHPAGASLDTIALPREGPDWSLLKEDAGAQHTRLDEYFVVVLDGRGQGQARRVIGRRAETLLLEQPWRIAPDANSTIVLTELLYRNLIVSNDIRDARKSGVWLWINGVENVIADNRLVDLGRGGILLFSRARGGPQSKPPSWPIGTHHLAGWNRGVGSSYFNTVTDNSVRNAPSGISIAMDDFRLSSGSVGWPLSMGNVLRNNQVEGSRSWGIWIGTCGKSLPSITTTAGFSLIGNLVEGNEVQGTINAYGADERSAGMLLRRNTARPDSTSGSKVEAFLRPSNVTGWMIENNQFGDFLTSGQRTNAAKEKRRPMDACS